MKRFDKFMIKVAELFGYPRESLAAADAGMRDLYETPNKEDFSTVAEVNTSWPAEWQDGKSPSEIAFKETEDRAHDLERTRVARHFAGLFAYSSFDETRPPPPRDPKRASHRAGLFLIDANHPGQAHVYYSGPSGDSPYWVLPSADSTFEYDMRQLTSAFEAKDRTKDDARNYEAKKAIVESRYPRARVLFAKLLEGLGIAPPQETQFADENGAKTFAAYRAFLPIADVLIARAGGDAKARLSAADAKTAVALADQDPKFAPALLAKLLGLALSGDMDGATAFAKEIEKNKLGVALTQRWAEMVSSRTKAFKGT
jgi:hypothetical protein